MEQRLKQRLLGTAVLVALAVIIVPEVVKTSGPIASPAVATSIPPRPESPQPGGVTVALPPAILPQAVPHEAPVPSGQTPASTIAQSPVIEPPRTPAALPLASPGGDGPQGMRTVDLGAGAPRVAPAAPPARPAAPKPAQPAPVVASAPAPKPVQAPAATASPSKPAPETVRATTDAPKPKPETVAKVAPATVTPAATARPVSLPKIELTSRDTSRASASAPAAEPWKPQAGNGSWAVQVGSFGVEENANLLRDRLRSQRFPAVVERIRGGGGQAMYRVRVVGQDSRPASEAIASRLRSAGVVANIVEPGE